METEDFVENLLSMQFLNGILCITIAIEFDESEAMLQSYVSDLAVSTEEVFDVTMPRRIRDPPEVYASFTHLKISPLRCANT